jgi:hypothetical protein
MIFSILLLVLALTPDLLWITLSTVAIETFALRAISFTPLGCSF